MQQQRITSCGDELYRQFESIYKGSFPIFEQRTREQQLKAFADKHYHLDVYTDDGAVMGFTSYWTFDAYTYMEHFAIAPAQRGHGCGSRILRDFLHKAEASGLTTILEIDPPVDDVAKARQRFYEHAGMTINPYVHRHPHYRPEFHAHELRIMTAPDTITRALYERFYQDLCDVVMK